MINSFFTCLDPYGQEIFPGGKGTGGILGKSTGRIKCPVEINGYQSPFVRFVQVKEPAASICFQCTGLICKNDEKFLSRSYGVEFLLHSVDTEAKYARTHILFHRADNGRYKEFPGFLIGLELSLDLPGRISRETLYLC